jgi:predicted ATPase
VPGCLFGRDRDVEFLGSFVDRAVVEGGSLLVWGDAGVGKTVLLDVAADHATKGGTRVLRAAGIQFEADVSFAGLNQLLCPLFGELDGLTSALSQALRVSLGLDPGGHSDQLVVSNAVVELLVRATDGCSVLVVIDDVQWLDRASSVAETSVLHPPCCP